MEKIILLTLFAVGINCYYIDNGTISKEKIVEGEYVSIRSVPYYAQVLNAGSLRCGAAIIAPHWLISAGHCFVGKISNLKIITGSSDRALPGSVHTITKIIIHKNYDNFTLNNDISLIKVKNPIIFNESQKPIKISKIPPKVGQRVKFSGFGDAGEDKASLPYLKAGRGFITNFDQCVEDYNKEKEVVTKNMFCTGSSIDDTCQGDSGGPLARAGQLVGIVSWGIGCGNTEYPSVNTQVANYVDWIEAKTGLKL